MKTYLKLQFSCEGELPSVVIKKLEDQGWRPIVGEKDFVMDGGIGESIGNSYLKKLDDLHNRFFGAFARTINASDSLKCNFPGITMECIGAPKSISFNIPASLAATTGCSEPARATTQVRV